MPRPLLNLNQVVVDPALMARIPYEMALYYLALPLACEEDQASVVMAHPENQTAVARLRELLALDLVAVRGQPAAIRAMLQQFIPERMSPPKILAWDGPTAIALAHLFGDAVGAEVTALTPAEADLGRFLAMARQDHYSLIVVDSCAGRRGELLSQAASPLLLARDQMRPLRRVLMAMRGYSSDEHALDWVIPLLRHSGAALTLMPIQEVTCDPLHQMLNGNALWREHLQGCLCRFGANGIHAHLKLREGRPAQQIAQEVADGDYDLLVIAAEGHGAFVGNVLDAVDRSAHNAQCSVLVMKPICT